MALRYSILKQRTIIIQKFNANIINLQLIKCNECIYIAIDDYPWTLVYHEHIVKNNRIGVLSLDVKTDKWAWN